MCRDVRSTTTGEGADVNVRDLHRYPPEVQAEVRASVRRVAEGWYTEWCPDRRPYMRTRWFRFLWSCKEQPKKWMRVAWRKVFGPDRAMLEAVSLSEAKGKA